VPATSTDEVIVSGPGETAIEVESDFVCDGLPLSLTDAVKLKVPLAVGVPEIAPATESVNPAGRLPEVIDHAYGAVPPFACTVCE
jgi:hypothetical protein